MPPVPRDPRDPRVLTISLHEHPVALWPAPATGRGERAEAMGSAVNVALPAATTDAGWLRACHALVPTQLPEFPQAGAGVRNSPLSVC